MVQYLYNSVDYDNKDMEQLVKDIDAHAMKQCVHKYGNISDKNHKNWPKPLLNCWREWTVVNEPK